MTTHIYVVDDDRALGRLSRMILQGEGMQAEAYTSPLDALNNLADASVENPAAIVLDLNMPEMDGREFYRRARAVGYSNPVLILSAYGADSAKRELGADAALPKPFEPEELATSVKKLLQSSGPDKHNHH